MTLAIVCFNYFLFYYFSIKNYLIQIMISKREGPVWVTFGSPCAVWKPHFWTEHFSWAWCRLDWEDRQWLAEQRWTLSRIFCGEWETKAAEDRAALTTEVCGSRLSDNPTQVPIWAVARYSCLRMGTDFRLQAPHYQETRWRNSQLLHAASGSPEVSGGHSLNQA